MFDVEINFVRSLYGEDGFIPLHEPRFVGNEKDYVNECINSTFVSSVGKFVDKFEQMICDFTGSKYAVATMNGTSALHLALVLADVGENDEVLTQALTFVATANAISYTGAQPVFIDSSAENLGMCPENLENFLKNNTEMSSDGYCYNKTTKKRIKACVPMHTFGHPVFLDQIQIICEQYNIFLIEDAAESLGSFYKGVHTGTIAPIGILSFNGNKIITSGGGGMLLIQDEMIAKKAKHLSTTAKIPHKWVFDHNEIGYNYRLPNLNAALACAQMENLPKFINNKRETAALYKEFFKKTNFKFVDEPKYCQSNFWLNAIICRDRSERDHFLEVTNQKGVMTRPLWKLMNEIAPFKNCQKTNLKNAEYYYDRIVNIPSSVRL